MYVIHTAESDEAFHLNLRSATTPVVATVTASTMVTAAAAVVGKTIRLRRARW